MTVSQNNQRNALPNGLGGVSLQTEDRYTFTGKDFGKQTKAMYDKYVEKYGKECVAVSSVENLRKPRGNIRNAILRLHTCHSDDEYQYKLRGKDQLTLLRAFYKYTQFRTYVGCKDGVSYWRLFPSKPRTEHYFLYNFIISQPNIELPKSIVEYTWVILNH